MGKSSGGSWVDKRPAEVSGSARPAASVRLATAPLTARGQNTEKTEEGNHEITKTRKRTKKERRQDEFHFQKLGVFKPHFLSSFVFSFLRVFVIPSFFFKRGRGGGRRPGGRPARPGRSGPGGPAGGGGGVRPRPAA